MAIPFDEILAELPPDRRHAIEIRSAELIAEYLTLQDLRKARALTQERMAELLGINQENVSRLEKRSDLLLSTLRSYVNAMGGRLDLVVQFPDRPPVFLSQIGDENTSGDGRVQTGLETRAGLRVAKPPAKLRPGPGARPVS